MKIEQITIDPEYHHKISNIHTGKNIGRLLIGEVVGYRQRKAGERKYNVAAYVATCSCGNICYITSEGITSGEVKSCGCLYRETRKTNLLPEGECAFNRIYTRYKNQAIKKNRVFSLNKEEFKYLIDGKCHYCGTGPSSVQSESTKYIYNGIDRKDNQIGYTLDNSVTCCSICNSAKGALEYTRFLSLCRTIADRHNN